MDRKNRTKQPLPAPPGGGIPIGGNDEPAYSTGEKICFGLVTVGLILALLSVCNNKYGCTNAESEPEAEIPLVETFEVYPADQGPPSLIFVRDLETGDDCAINGAEINLVRQLNDQYLHAIVNSNAYSNFNQSCSDNTEFVMEISYWKELAAISLHIMEAHERERERAEALRRAEDLARKQPVNR